MKKISLIIFLIIFSFIFIISGCSEKKNPTAPVNDSPTQPVVENTLTETETVIDTYTETQTETPIATYTDTFTFTDTMTDTVTDTPTVTFTETYTPDPLLIPIINEVDPSTSTSMEDFIELYTKTPNTSLNGYTLVLYNGATDLVYYFLDLDGYSTDANGYFVLGGSGISGRDYALSNSLIQNGTDAVAIYQADGSDFYIGKVITGVGLIDMLVYGSTYDPGLQTYTTGTIMADTYFTSLQRIPDGSGLLRNLDSFYLGTYSPGSSNNLPATATQTFTITDTPTDTATDTSTVTPVDTETLTMTYTPTETDTETATVTGTETATATPLGWDQYEDLDDTWDWPTELTLGVSQTHGFDVAGDNDWVMFDAAADVVYTIETFNLGADTDTNMYLYYYDAPSHIFIGQNDDYMGGPRSLITWHNDSAILKNMMVRVFDAAGNGGTAPDTSYDVRVVEIGTATFTETATETSTETPTDTATGTVTDTVTDTPTETESETVTETETITETQTITETPTESPTPYWETVGSSLSTGAADHISLFVHDHKPYIAFEDTTGLRVVKYNGSFSDVGGEPVTKTAVNYVSLQVDSGGVAGDGHVFVAYEDEGNLEKGAVQYYNGVSWTAYSYVGTTITGEVSMTDLYIYGSDIYLAFRAGAGTTPARVLKWTGLTASGWDYVGGPDIYSASADRPVLSGAGGNLYIAYGESYVVDNGEAVVQMWNGTSWNQIGSNINGDDSIYHSIFAVSANEIYVCFGDADSGNLGLSVYKWNGATWSILGSAGSATTSYPSDTSMKYYSSVPYVGTADSGTGSYWVKYWTGSTWSVLGGEAPGSGNQGDMVIDASGKYCYVAYSDSTNGNTVTLKRYKLP